MIAEIKIDKGTFKVPYAPALKNSPFADRLVNMIIGPSGENLDRPTLQSFATLPSTNIIGMYMFKNLAVCVTDDRKIYTVNSTGLIDDITSVLLPGTARPQFTDDTNSVYIVGGGTPIQWAPSGLTSLLGGSPPEMTHIVFLDGYLIGNRRSITEHNKVVQFSGLDTPTSWSAIDIFSAVAEPDEISGLAVSQRELYVVGQQTTELWQNIGSSPLPFSRAHVWNFGSLSPYSILSLDDSVFYLDRERRVIRIEGRQPTHMSEAIDFELSMYEDVTDCFASHFTWNGSRHVLFMFPSAEVGWSVDLRNGQWSEWKGYDTNGFAAPRVGALVYDSVSKRGYAGDPTTGDVWQLSDDSATDAGGIFKRLRRLSYFDGGASVRKRCNFLRCQIKRNVASAHSGTTSQTNPKLELRWRDEDNNWSNHKAASLGTIGTGDGYVTFRRLGLYRSRQFELQMSDPSSMHLVGIEMDTDVMVS